MIKIQPITIATLLNGNKLLLLGYLNSLSNLLCYICEPKREFGIRSGERYTIGKSDGLHHPMKGATESMDYDLRGCNFSTHFSLFS